MNRISRLVILGAMALVVSNVAIAASGSAHIEHAGTNVRDTHSLQNGAKLFVSYCLSCHSASYMRYNRLADDLELTEEQVTENLIFSDAKFGETMKSAMTSEQGTEWLGKAPPDLSVVARSRGVDWLYSYLKTFYRDEYGAWNNLVFPNASMPHVMWRLQGIQKPVYETVGDEEVIDQLIMETPGLQSPEEYDETVRDLVTFLEYMSEPAQLKRKNIGVWVMLFLTVFALLAYALKAEFWRDVH